jgi:hypothetical protein
VCNTAQQSIDPASSSNLYAQQFCAVSQQLHVSYRHCCNAVPINAANMPHHFHSAPVHLWQQRTLTCVCAFS